LLIKMAEALIEHIWAMAGVFVAFVAVVFGVRGGGHKAREEMPESS
jgi:hypothetical protein